MRDTPLLKRGNSYGASLNIDMPDYRVHDRNQQLLTLVSDDKKRLGRTPNDLLDFPQYPSCFIVNFQANQFKLVILGIR